MRIPVNNNSGSIRINVKPLSSGKFSAYAYFAYVKDNKKQNELINTITMSVPVITIEAKSPTSNATISVSGVAEPSKKVNIYVDNKIAGSVKAKKNGMYVMNLQLHNPVNSHVYKIEAQEDYDQTIKADISVVYNEATPELTKFDMYYQAHEWLKMDLLSTIGTKQAVSIYPGYPFTFMIKYDNPDQIYKVYVVSSKNGKNMYLEAEPTANKGEFIATGYFDENNKNYIPGSIGIKYINKVGQEIYNYPLKSNNEFISDELKNVETEITEDQEEYGSVQLKLENGSTMDVTIARTSEAKLRTRYLSEKRSDRKKVATLTASVSTDEQDVINFFNDFRKKLGDRLIEDRDDFVLAWNENRTEIIYILWDATHDTFMEVGIKYAPTWMMEDTLNTIGYYEHGMTNAQIASQYAPVLVGELTAFYKGINGYNDYQTILREIKDSDMSESEKAYAIKKVENTEVAFGVISALRVALPLIKMGVTAYNPVLGAVGAVVVDEALNLYEKYLMNKADYYKNEGIGEYTFINWLIDPSGYVYEAVQQNRIQGAKVTAYYKENLEDKAVIWNASEFSQKNPLYSDSEGYYAWDTPEGYWQVKVEKEGYEIWTSEWLSVPPVQNNINVPLVSKSVPTVEWINVYEEYAEIHFTKYMKPGNMNEIKVLDDKNHEIPYSISYSKENTSEDGTVYANTFRLIFSEPLQKRQKCIVIVPGKLQSYSGITCAEKTYTKTVKSPCAMEIAEDVTVDYGSQITIPITLDSYDEAAEINAVSACPNLARVVSVEKSDLDGVWNVIIEGRLPGETKIMISVKDTDIEQTVSVSIKMNNTFKGFDEDVHKHSWDKGIISQKATCTKVGKKLFTCIDCKETWIQEIPVDKEAHTFSTVIDKKVTCGTAGKQHRVCVECNYKEATINIPATGKHKLVFKVDRSPTCGAAGRKHKECSICGHKETAVNIPATGKHKYGSYVISQKPTVLKKGTKIRICSVCKKKDIALMPKLTPSIKLNVTNITLKMNQSTTKIKVSNLAAGDKVKYWKSSNTKIVKVSNSGKITAQKKPGTATLTVVLLSGKKTTIKVKVQKGDVKTTKILGLAKTATMKVKKTLTLRPIISPITSTQKITYATSNKGIATVNSKGVITAKKPGKVKITVKSGAKKFVITVTVKK